VQLNFPCTAEWWHLSVSQPTIFGLHVPKPGGQKFASLATKEAGLTSCERVSHGEPELLQQPAPRLAALGHHSTVCLLNETFQSCLSFGMKLKTFLIGSLLSAVHVGLVLGHVVEACHRIIIIVTAAPCELSVHPDDAT